MEITIKINRLNGNTITVTDRNEVRLLYLKPDSHKGLYDYFDFKLRMSESSEGTDPDLKNGKLPIPHVSESAFKCKNQDYFKECRIPDEIPECYIDCEHFR
jgi:hypothetical protein